ncbi:roadblock/LC7 domain-containing protein [Micromonospora sp. NBC_01813]|uniref:roadblock/LC7 domain-containing protein n=1 Tax=Micromonospora sp. NBC_01813 TaxID=2975988 RepID=UPI002DDA3C86|nr:roadblock/LC7 domain-containing protein [Micromonospora sp. NBC_01813]WSA08638.1 roadblock/LC7 domain-containing protein [Micromonospora sp. NBC_01813]
MTSPNDLSWLLQNFVSQTPEVSHALAISTDGLVLAHNYGLPRDRADQLAATGSGLIALLMGAARFFEAGTVISNVTQMDGGFMFCMSFSDGASLLVLASPICDVGQVSYEMTDLANRMGEALTPTVRAGLLRTL